MPLARAQVKSPGEMRQLDGQGGVRMLARIAVRTSAGRSERVPTQRGDKSDYEGKREKRR